MQITIYLQLKATKIRESSISNLNSLRNNCFSFLFVILKDYLKIYD